MQREGTMKNLDDEFFARVGHDLRGELATMQAGIHYLLRYEKQLESAHREMLERVRGAGERLRRLLDEFDHAVWLRPDSRRPLAMGPYDPVELVQELTRRLDEAAAARDVRLFVESELREGELPLTGDAELLLVALEYVAGLAILRSRDGAVRIRVARTEPPAVTIADEAGPVAPELLDRLLEPFVERAAIPVDCPAPASPPGGQGPPPGVRRRASSPRTAGAWRSRSRRPPGSRKAGRPGCASPARWARARPWAGVGMRDGFARATRPVHARELLGQAADAQRRTRLGCTRTVPSRAAPLPRCR
jgi:hypothetical protein